MEARQATDFSGSLQTICESQTQKISRLIADCEAQAVNPGGAFLDFVRSGTSGRFPAASEDGAAVERRMRELEDLLTMTQSLTALGQTIAALVHEVSQPLTATSNYAAGCRHLVRLGRYDELDGVLQQIIDQGDRAFQIAHRIRELVGASDRPDEIAPPGAH